MVEHLVHTIGLFTDAQSTDGQSGQWVFERTLETFASQLWVDAPLYDAEQIYRLSLLRFIKACGVKTSPSGKPGLVLGFGKA